MRDDDETWTSRGSRLLITADESATLKIARLFIADPGTTMNVSFFEPGCSSLRLSSADGIDLTEIRSN